MSCGAFAVCGALEGHCEVFCGSFDVDGLVDELPVCGGVGGCQLIAAALCFEGEAAVLVGVVCAFVIQDGMTVKAYSRPPPTATFPRLGTHSWTRSSPEAA